MTNFKIVPVEPTWDMEETGQYSLEAGCYAGDIYANMLADAPAVNIVATKNEQGQIVSVTLQDEDHRILEVIAEAAAQGEPIGYIRRSALELMKNDELGVRANIIKEPRYRDCVALYTAPQPPSAPVGVDDGINVPAAKALIKIVGPGFKVIYRDAFRWKDASGDVLPNHYETFSAETLARDFGYDLVLDLGYAAILRDPSDLSQQPTEHRPCPEDIREGAPYDDPAFEALCREHEIWGTAAAAQCAVFWEAGKRVAEQQPAPDVEGLEEAPITVIYTDGCGAGRRSPADCRDGVGYITVADTVYWPLSADDAQRLRSAECGRGDFTGPANECPDVSALVEELVEALDLARIDLKEWLKSFPNASREPTGKIIERIDAALAAYRKQGDKT